VTCLHGPIQYLQEYPDVRLTTPSEREFARRLHDELVAAAKEQNWRDLSVAADLGYNTNKAPRKPVTVWCTSSMPGIRRSRESMGSSTPTGRRL